jgi:hypothetical protein
LWLCLVVLIASHLQLLTATNHVSLQTACRTRAPLPSTFTAGIDRLHLLTCQAAGKQQQRINSDSLPGSSSNSSPAGSPLRTNVYGFPQVPYTRITNMLPHMLLDKVMEVCAQLRCAALAAACAAVGMSA